MERNIILKIEDEVVYVDVSTKKHPNTVAKVDVPDIGVFNDGNGRWQARTSKTSGPYVCRNKKGHPTFMLHRVILGLEDWNIVGDHKNKDGLDNRRENIRVATRNDNARNCTAHKNTTSKYLGVWKDDWGRNKKKIWRAGIRINRGKLRHLGRFANEDDAAKAYDKAAIELFGEFANPNFSVE